MLAHGFSPHILSARIKHSQSVTRVISLLFRWQLVSRDQVTPRSRSCARSYSTLYRAISRARSWSAEWQNVPERTTCDGWSCRRCS
jgi:hypothetical protein